MKKLHQLTDDKLVALYIKGTDEAFDELLARYQNRLYSYILYTVQNADLADDLFQETFAKAIFHLREGRYTESGKFYAWISCIAHNLIADLYRNEKNMNTISDEEAGMELYNAATFFDNSSENLLANEQTLQDIKHLITCLPPEQQEIVQLRYYQNLSFKEIADLKQMSINTALGRMRYAILNIRKLAAKQNIPLYWY